MPARKSKHRPTPNSPARPTHPLPSAAQGAADAKRHADTPQTLSPAYNLAFADQAFLLQDEMRGVRLQIEYAKPALIQAKEGIESTIVVFGSARVQEKAAAEARLQSAQRELDGAPQDPLRQRALTIARRQLENSRYYDEARELARLVSTTCQIEGHCNYVITTGGGPGIMEAANRGAHDVQAKSIGLNIVLPMEQAPNPYITPELCFQFHYFALRKLHFLMRAAALVCFPGGYGTLDELFETLTLIQTRKVDPIPVILFGREFWERIVNFNALVEEGMISPGDPSLFRFVESAQEAWDFIRQHHQIGQPTPPAPTPGRKTRS